MEREQDKGSAKESSRKVDARDNSRGEHQPAQQQEGAASGQQQSQQGQKPQQTDDASQGRESGSIASHKVKEDLHQSVHKS